MAPTGLSIEATLQAPGFADEAQAQLAARLTARAREDFGPPIDSSLLLEQTETCTDTLVEKSQRALVALLSDPEAVPLGAEGLEYIFNQSTGGLARVWLFRHESGAWLTAIDPGHCQVLRYSPYARYYVFDGAKEFEPLGQAGPFRPEVSPVPNGWVVTVAARPENDVARSVWHVRREGVGWTRSVVFAEAFEGAVRLEADYRRLIIRYQLTYGPRPCLFRPEIEAAIESVNYHDGERIYEWMEGMYRLAGETHRVWIRMHDVPMAAGLQFLPEAHEHGGVTNWQDYCLGTPFPDAFTVTAVPTPGAK